MTIMTLLLVLAAAACRLVDHPWNFGPLGAMALVGGLYFGKRFALIVPLAALAVTDLILNARGGYPLFYAGRFFDYGAFLLIGLGGLWLRNRTMPAKLTGALTTPFLFYFISNFGVWLTGLNLAGMPYEKSLSGLFACYVAGLPFLRGTIIGDYLFIAVLAGAIAVSRLSIREPHTVSNPVTE